jgi:hypothetical protein
VRFDPVFESLVENDYGKNDDYDGSALHDCLKFLMGKDNEHGLSNYS